MCVAKKTIVIRDDPVDAPSTLMYLGFLSAQQVRKNMAAVKEKAMASVVKGRKEPARPERTTLLRNRAGDVRPAPSHWNVFFNENLKVMARQTASISQ